MQLAVPHAFTREYQGGCCRLAYVNDYTFMPTVMDGRSLRELSTVTARPRAGGSPHSETICGTQLRLICHPTTDGPAARAISWRAPMHAGFPA